MQNLPDADQRLEAMFRAFDDLLFILDYDGTILDYEAGDVMHLYIPPAQFLQRKMQDVLPDHAGKKFAKALQDLRDENKIVLVEYFLPTPAGECWYESRLAQLPNERIIVFVRDITKYKQSQSKIKHQLDHLAALRAIDLAITSGMDLNLTLSMVLQHVRTQLHIDAAAILLFNPDSHFLEFAASVGFTTSALKQTRLRIGEGYAGRVILERKALHIENLKSQTTDFIRSPYFKNENFISYYAIPLIAKGQALGVLEIFHRAPIEADFDWLDFMDSLAGQAAIAIDNAILFRDLQASNAELTSAYDRTIEGWSRALDLRDKETEGHSRRVTELTLQLAQQMNIPESDLVHIRRGAMLHDIGKVAIPDGILLKPAPLTKDEWEVMRQHPLIAVKLLTHISYLVPALDIPHYHHEKWDGTGYPHGLLGESIPLSARLFALADVYDALTSDRPYRPAWSNKKALDYIRSETGKQFDPGIASQFMRLTGAVA